MSVDLRLEWGSTTIELANGSLSIVTGYDEGIVSKDPARGEEVVSDAIRLRLIGNLTTILSTVASINKLLERARERTEKPFLNRVYIVRSAGDGSYYRSEILDGKMLFDTEALHALGRKPEIEFAITRLNYWESTTLTELPLTNGNGSGATGGLMVYPWDDSVAGRDNWVKITGTTVLGDMEAPIRLELENTYNSVNRTDEVYVGVNWNSSPNNLAPVLQGELADTGGSVLPVSPDTALYCGGQYRECSVGTTEATVMRWTLDSTNLGYFAGNDFTALLRLINSVQADTWARLRVTIGGLVTLYETPAVLLPTGTPTSKLFSLGRVQLPPYLVNSGTALGSLYFELRMWRSAGTYTQGVDYIQLMPMDSYRKIENLGWDLEYGETLVCDDVEGYIFAVWGPGFGTSAGAYGYHIPFGTPLMVKPGVDQKIYIVVTGATPGARTSKVRLYYRPRRQTL